MLADPVTGGLQELPHVLCAMEDGQIYPVEEAPARLLKDSSVTLRQELRGFVRPSTVVLVTHLVVRHAQHMLVGIQPAEEQPAVILLMSVIVVGVVLLFVLLVAVRLRVQVVVHLL